MSNVRLWPAEWDEPFEIAGRRVDPVARTISHNDEVKSVEPRIIALLVALADKPLAVCRRDDLIKKIWPNSPGADQSLSNAMSLLRRALGDNGASGNQLIKTIPKLGYQLTVKVVRDKPPDASPRSPTRSRRFPAIIGMLTLIAVATAAILGFLTDRPDAGGQASDSRVTVAILPFSANEALLPKAMAMHDATRQLVDAAYDV
ncbi:MAG: winged helix-turn-helix domain-containing protein, partial [Pseudomonadota bacterium]